MLFQFILSFVNNLPTLFMALTNETNISISFIQGGKTFRLTKRTKILSNQLYSSKYNKKHLMQPINLSRTRPKYIHDRFRKIIPLNFKYL